MLAVPKSPAKDCNPLPCDAYSPALLLNLIQSTHRHLLASDNRRIYDKVSTLFADQPHVHVLYRVPLRVALLTPQLKLELRDALYEAIQQFDVWLVYLRIYV